MNAYWQNIWKSFPISIWSAALYLVLSYWASKKLPSKSYKRIKRLAAWVDAICIIGVVVLIGDMIWIMTSYFRWDNIYYEEPISYIFLPLARNISMIVVCMLLMSRNWLREGYINLNREVIFWAGLNILYIFLCFYLAPGKEWTHWQYALENGYACWPYVWFISYPIGRAITSLLWVKMWSTKHVS